MTYNVFGGTLTLTQSALAEVSAFRVLLYLQNNCLVYVLLNCLFSDLNSYCVIKALSLIHI